MSLYDCINLLDDLISNRRKAGVASSINPELSFIQNLGINFSLFESINESAQNAVKTHFEKESEGGLSLSADDRFVYLRDKLRSRTEVPSNYQGLFNDIQEVDELIELFKMDKGVNSKEINALIGIKEELQFIHLRYIGMDNNIKAMDVLLSLRESENTAITEKVDGILSAPTKEEAKYKLKELEEASMALDQGDPDRLKIEFILNSFHERSVEIANKYQKYLVAEICQDAQYELGTSGGECYGFGMAMADTSLSPYGKAKEASPPQIRLTQMIHDYQINQTTDNDGLNKIRKTSLQNKKLCVGSLQQAEKILNMGRSQRGTHLLIALEASNESKRGHSCYFNYLETGQIRYADPNGHAYEFENEQEFLNYYQDVFKKDYAREGVKEQDEFHFITIYRLEEQPQIDFGSERNTGKKKASYDDSSLARFHDFQSKFVYPVVKFTYKITSEIITSLQSTCKTPTQYCTEFRQKIQDLRANSKDPSVTCQDNVCDDDLRTGSGRLNKI